MNKAILFNAGLSTQKGRLVADLIRGRHIKQALNILSFSNKKGSKIIKKVLNSAISNAVNNNDSDIRKLKIKKINIEQGQCIKKTLARAKGKADRISKKRCHIYVIIGN